MLTPTGVTAENYWNAIKAGNRQHIRMTFPGNIVLDESDIKLGGVRIHDVMNGDTDLTFGKAVMRELSVQFVNSDKLANINWTAEFTLELGVEISGSTKWVTVGLFRGDRPEKIHYVNVINFTAYDRMQQFEIPAEEFLGRLSYPQTFAQILSALCTYIGVTYTAGNELANIKTRSFNRNFLDSSVITCRDLLSVMAEACGCYAKITSAGALKMVWFNSASYSLDATEEFSVDAFDIGGGKTWEEMRSYTWEQARQFTWADLGGYHTVFGVSGLNVKLTEDDIGVTYGSPVGNVYMIVDNPFLAITEDAVPDTYIKPIYERLHDFGGYLPMTIECIGNWLLETGDVITVDVRGQSMELPLFSIDIVWNGECISAYQATGSIKGRTLTSTNRQKIANGGKYHEFKVDIDSLSSEIADTRGNVNRLEQTATQLTSRISNAEGDINTLEQTATSLTSRIESAEGDISSVEQDVNGLTTRVGNAEGDISTLEQNVSGLSSTVQTATGDISTLQQTTQTIQGTVEQKSRIFYGSTTPTGTQSDPVRAGDYWIDTANNNATKRYNGSTWVDASYSDPDIASIILSVSKKARIYYSSTTPTGSTSDPLTTGDLWIDTANANQLKRYNGSSWADASFDDPDKYTVRSGIDIKAEGIEITGGKYVKIFSNGVFDVNATNFKIDSVNKIFQTGRWEMSESGFKYSSALLSGSYLQISSDDTSTYGLDKYVFTIHSKHNPSGSLQDVQFIFTQTGQFYVVGGVSPASLGSGNNPWRVHGELLGYVITRTLSASQISVDLNDFTTNGSYYMSSLYVTGHLPSSMSRQDNEPFVLEVTNYDDNDDSYSLGCFQKLWTEQNCYTRMRKYSESADDYVWGSWYVEKRYRV